MKLLLTSNGISNPSIAEALFELAGKKPEELSLVFIPTAANGVTGEKDWLEEDLENVRKLGLKQLTIVDISAVGTDVWKPQLEAADILFFEGGNTYYLMEWIEKSGLKALLPEMLATKVYVGVSAGSMVTNKDLLLSIGQVVYGEGLDKSEDVPALGFVDFYFLPHLGSEYFPNVRKEKIAEAIANTTRKTYALDDESALKVVDGNIEVVTEGEYLEFN